MLHALLPKKGIQLVPENNDLANNIIGAMELFNDLKGAWEEIQKDSYMSSFFKKENALEIQGTVSGATHSL